MKYGHETRKVGESRFHSDTRRHHLGSWLRALAGICLAATLIGGSVMVTGGITTAGAHARTFAPAPSESCPLPPIGVTVKATASIFQLKASPDDKQVHLTWQPQAPAQGFVIYDWPAQDSSKVAKVDTASGSDYLVKGLTNGTTYCFVIVRGQLAYPVSNTVSATPATVPGAPTGLTATPGNSQVTLSWTAPASNGGSQVTGYNVFEGTTPDLSGNAPIARVTGTAVTLADLTNGTTYYFWVTAVNGVGDGPASNEVPAIPATVPGAPTGLTATPGNSQVTLSWTAPASNGGSQVTGYDLYAGTTADLSGNTPIARVTGTAVTVTNLTNGTRYYFWVTAVNGVGDGPASNEVPAIPATVPGAPTGLTATPGNSQVTLSWAAPASGGAAISGYLIFEGTRPGGENHAPVNGSLVTATSYRVTGLTNGTTYYFRVIAVNAVGQGPLSAEAPAPLLRIVPTSPPATTPTSGTTTPTVTPLTSAGSTATPPAAPAGLTASPGDTEVHLSWTAPALDGGSVISYKVYLASRPGVQESTAIGTSTSADATVTGLINGTTYYFMVAAVDAAGNESPLSAEVAAEPTGPPPDPVVPMPAPGPPKWLITLLTAGAAMVVAGAITLIARRGGLFRSRERARQARSRGDVAGASDVRAVPDTARPDVVKVRDTGREPTHTVRIEPYAGIVTTMIKEAQP
jgi:fibronectin type 3 domain-containing protein